MEHKGTNYTETQRLLLRPFCMDDLNAMFLNFESDVKMTEFLRWQATDDIALARQVLQGWIDSYARPDFYQWAIVPKELNEPIGTISVVGMNEQVGSVEIGYCIGSKWWHHGFTSEAFAAIIPYLFDEVGASRVESRHDPNNPNSGKVMQKCGLHYEGTLRQADWSNKGIVDACVYGLLKSDWEKS